MRLVWLGLMLVGCGAPEPERAELPPSVAPPPPGPTLAPDADEVAPMKPQVQRIVQENKPSLLGCYEVAKSANSALQGQIELRWTITQGAARDVQLRKNTTGDRGLAECMAAKVGGWSFSGADDGTVQNTWYFPAPETAGSKVSFPPNDAQPAGVERVLKSNRGQLAWCYERALRSHPDLTGELRMSWTLVGGLPTDVQADANTTGDKELEACVIGKVWRWVFTGVEDGRVTNTFVFKPKEGAP